MRSRRNLFSCIARSLTHSDSAIIEPHSSFRGANKVLLDRGVFVETDPLRGVRCPNCGEDATINGHLATCGECDSLFSVSDVDLRQFVFSHGGMAALLQSELHLTNRRSADGYDCFRAPNGRTVYYIHREVDVNRTRLMGEHDPYLIYGSADPAPPSRDDPPGMEVTSIDSVFEVRDNGVIWTCQRALDITEVHERSAATVNDKNRIQQVRRALLAKLVLEAVRRLARSAENIGCRSARKIYDRFGERLVKMNKECAASYKTIEGDVKALCEDRVFEKCWKALVSGVVDSAESALRSLDNSKDAMNDDGVDPDSLMRSLAKQRADGGYVEDEVEVRSALPYTDDDSFWADIDRRIGELR